ncbi:MAG: esterase [Burkholderiaceae bacterium]|nr:MAG: esterase [Burkholderiaceae bacterium]
MILYLHGFRSSPQSFKARLLAAHFKQAGREHEFVCPALPASPAAAIRMARDIVAQHPDQTWSLIGSSLGGFYANYLAEELGCRAVLLNPAVKPPRDLASYVGVTTAYHSDDVFEFKYEYIDELRALVVDQITFPERYFLLAATGDEVLDWREMTAHYAGAKQLVIEGSDHGISEFSDYMQAVLDFCDAR